MVGEAASEHITSDGMNCRQIMSDMRDVSTNGDILRKIYCVSNRSYGNYTGTLEVKALHSFGLKPYFLFTCVKLFIQFAPQSMNASATTAAFDVKKASLAHNVSFEHTVEWLDNAPRLPVDLALVLIEIRKKLGWTMQSINVTLVEGIGEHSDNPVIGTLVADEGVLSLSVDVLGLSADLSTQSINTLSYVSVNDVRLLLESSQPFMPSMTEEGWIPPGLDDPFMKQDPNEQEFSPENGWPAGFQKPEEYMRMGQGVNGDMFDCAALPEDPESFFFAMINAARETRVSIMGVMFRREGLNLHGSLAISESSMDMFVLPEYRRAYISFFTCGNSNPRPSLDYLHAAFDGDQTNVSGFVRGREVPFLYTGVLERGMQKTVWDPVDTAAGETDEILA